MTLVTFDTCQCWQLSSFRPYFWTKNGKCFNFDEISNSTQIEAGEFNGGNIFLWFLMLVNFDLCQYWHLPCFRPQIWTKNDKCFNFDKILYSAQIEGAEFNGDNSFFSFWRSSVKFDTCQLKFSENYEKCMCNLLITHGSIHFEILT